MIQPSLADILAEHLSRYRGSWIKNLTPELKRALEAIDSSDLKRAATILIHGEATCRKGRERSFKRIKDGWQFCATNGKCPCFIEHFHQTSEATNWHKRGVKNAAQSDVVKAKMKETCFSRYGVAYAGSSKQQQEKAEATNLKKFGVKNVFASDAIKAAIHDKTLALHGVDHISKSPQHQARMKQGMQHSWGVANPAQHPMIKDKIRTTNKKRYGGNAPACCPQVQQKMRSMMEQRLGGHISQLHISPQHRIHSKVDFAQRFGGRRATDIATETGYDPSMIYRFADRWDVALDHSAGSYREAENNFAARLEQEGLQFERNGRVLIPDGERDRRRYKEIDIYFPQHKLGIEYCGVFWHSDAAGRDKYYHLNKLALARAHGIDLLQIFEDEWAKRPEAVVAAIVHRLKQTKQRIFARKGQITVVAHHDAAAFYDRHHVFGAVRATVHLGLTFDGHLHACMSFTRRSERRWELVRYATHNSVVGGASRLLIAFERRYDWDTIVSFVDLRWSKGDLYWTLGFEWDATLDPDYSYVIGDQRFHKFNFRKTGKRFAKYAETTMTERQMAEAERLPRIYDAGKLRVIKRRQPS